MTLILNGRAVSWSQVEMTLGPSVSPTLSTPLATTVIPLQMPTVTEISYKKTINRAKAYGSGPRAYDMTLGKIEIDAAKVVIGMSDFAVFWNLLGGDAGAYTGKFNLTVNYSYDPTQPCTDILKDCRVKSVSTSAKEGPEPVMVEIELDVLDVTLVSPVLDNLTTLGF